jgi:hypothetical protein
VDYGINFYYGQKSYLQFETTLGFYYPVRLGGTALIPFVDGGLGFIKFDRKPDSLSLFSADSPGWELKWNLSVQGGLMFTVAAVPGLYAQAYYHYNFIADRDNNSLIGISVGYGI